MSLKWDDCIEEAALNFSHMLTHFPPFPVHAEATFQISHLVVFYIGFDEIPDCWTMTNNGLTRKTGHIENSTSRSRIENSTLIKSAIHPRWWPELGNSNTPVGGFSQWIVLATSTAIISLSSSSARSPSFVQHPVFCAPREWLLFCLYDSNVFVPLGFSNMFW